jgi:hypothetical protein
MIRSFQILAVGLIAAAAFFLWRGEMDTAFVTGVLGICSFFLAVRFTFRQRVTERAEANLSDEVDDNIEPDRGQFTEADAADRIDLKKDETRPSA